MRRDMCEQEVGSEQQTAGSGRWGANTEEGSRGHDNICRQWATGNRQPATTNTKTARDVRSKYKHLLLAH